MLRTMMIPICLTLALSAFGQEIQLKSTPSTLSVVQGEPMELSLIATNTSGKDLTLIGPSLTEALHCDSRLFKGEREINCWAEHATIVTSPNLPAEAPKSTFKAGASMTWPGGVFSHTACALRDVVPGHYSGRFTVTGILFVSGHSTQNITVELDIPIEIAVPTGEDAAYIADLMATVQATDPKKIKGPSFQARPLQWREVSQSERVDVRSVLDRHPTSIYAGYRLAHNAPSQALWALSCLSEPDESLRKYSNRGGGEENTRRHIASAQAEMQSYVKAAQPFLEAHPNFLYAPLIRRLLAMSLGLTGHTSDAVAELRILADGEGHEAEEAKAFLARQEKTGQDIHH